MSLLTLAYSSMCTHYPPLATAPTGSWLTVLLALEKPSSEGSDLAATLGR